MSTFEYNDLFCKCQYTGMYHLFVLDIKGSKQMNYNERNDAEVKLIKLMLMVYKELLEIEKQQNKTILVFEKDFSYFGEERINDFGMKQEPFLYGDTIGFTVYRDSISNDEIINIVKRIMCFLKIDFTFHFSDGYYETNDWVEGNTKYFRGHCIDLLSNLHKSYNKSIVEFLQNHNKHTGIDISVDIEEKENKDDIFFEDDFEVVDLKDKITMLSEKYNFAKYKKIK